MKIVLASPNYPQLRGNTITVQRIADNLERLGVETKIVSTTDDSIIRSFPTADIVHGFHAYNFYKFLQKLDKKPAHYIVTITGTDLNQDLFNPKKRMDVLASLHGAKAVHVFDKKAKALLIEEIPKLGDKIFVMPQGNQPSLPGVPHFTKEPDSFLFFLPAGIRKVKNIPEAIGMLQELRLHHPQIRLWLVGPVLEEEEGNQVMDLIDRHKDWIHYLGQVPHEDMGSIYRQTDAVLNTSLSEGQPATILEAMGYALPVLASDIPGNSGIISDGETGLLYKTRNEFLDYAEKLVNNNKIRQSIGQSAEAYVKQHHSSEQEADTLLKVYQQILK
ncbi:glycosyltransferase involved in cell wall biosynthesis [Planomicrobium stackebrandtii]|uniref:Glycosyltransferase involved in cell wall biosynthesis n=1 Tax=Planomicrobium stackebrandtii TaxID=253160 RepID=A0ABU0GTM3_9BACL|nr:glycosyltransferase [Planomicrobium stackebrandtii]MDQ0428714.1 glycosyltransferase involved in cell wall biosynthesis [Planomicrobium stackebrandtii]